jgi:hypothetical protein
LHASANRTQRSTNPGCAMNLQSNYRLSREELARLRGWFERYVRSFYTGDPAARQVLTLKERHSLRVCREILEIGSKFALGKDHLMVAEAMALLHDIGRFEQYTRHHTFSDGKSEDHASLGISILRREHALSALAENTRDLILKAVSYHNRLTIPEDEDPDCIFFCRLLRDADKLDIFALFAAYYQGSSDERNAAVELDLPDTPHISEDVLADLEQGNMVRMRQLKQLNDFKLLQLAWVYDVNFQPTFQMIYERGYLESIRAALPASERIDRIYSRLISYLETRAR